MPLELGGDVLRERVARVVHRAQQALDLEPRIEMRAHLLHRLHEIGQTFERVVLALHRDQHRVGGAEAVQRQQRQRRRTVEQDEIVFAAIVVDRRRASGAALRRARPSVASRAREDRPARLRRRRARDSPARDRSRRIGDCTRTSAIARSPSSTWYTVRAKRALVDAGARGRVALRVEVDQQHAPLHRRRGWRRD